MKSFRNGKISKKNVFISFYHNYFTFTCIYLPTQVNQRTIVYYKCS